MRTSGVGYGAALGALGLTAVVARRWLKMRDAVAAVPADLRSPVLAFISVPYSVRTLPFIRWVFNRTSKPGPGVTVIERHARSVDGGPEVRVLVTTPSQSQTSRPALLWIHGGGMVVGSPQLEVPIHARLARELGAVVVSPDYRLAPEHPFPAPLDDCMAALRWMREHADELGIDANRIAVGGASSGGGLSAAVAQRSVDEGITLRAQVLVYPMLDDRTALRENHAGRGHFMWTPTANHFGWTAYLGREPRMSDAPQYAAPSRRTDLTGVAPAWIGVGELDLFYPEVVDYADKLTTAGVAHELVTVPGMYHGADGLAAKAPAMQEFSRGMLEHLRKFL